MEPDQGISDKNQRIRIGSRTVTHALFSAANGFKKIIVDKKPADGLLLDSPLFTVSAVRLSHGTPCLAYRLDGKLQFKH